MILGPEGGPHNHWISFQLEGAGTGTKTNRLALNARIRATAGDLVQLGEVFSGGSYLSQHDLRLHFGLGSRERLDKAEVLWPDGKGDTHESGCGPLLRGARGNERMAERPLSTSSNCLSHRCSAIMMRKSLSGRENPTFGGFNSFARKIESLRHFESHQAGCCFADSIAKEHEEPCPGRDHLGHLIGSVAGYDTRVDLDRDWLFRTDPDQIGEKANWQKNPPPNADSVSVPHTWNLGRHDGYLGKAWYFKTFDLPMRTAELHVKLHFGATFYVARVWLNGVELGTHEGGYTAYSFDITRQLQRTNQLAVELDNRIGASTIPGLAQRGEDHAWYDWWDYGGIVRDVWLTVGGPVEVQRQQIRSQIVEGEAVIEDRIFLESSLMQKKLLSVLVTALGPDNESAGREVRALAVSPGLNYVAILLKVGKAGSDGGIDHPNLYRMRVQILNRQGDLLDESIDTFGVRKIEIRDRHLLINGERERLTGIARHEDSVWEGLAETPGTMRHDYSDMRSLHMTLTRPVHYPQNSFILDYADQHGILLIPEIPVWQFSEMQLKNPRVIELAKQQLREMIEESGNHPSILAWSVCNESDTGTPGGIAYFRAMRDYIRELDPSRFVTYADDHLPKLKRAEDSAANDADFLMMNGVSFGSWHGLETELAESLDRIGGMFPGKMMIISEFGLAGIFAKNPEEADRMRIRIISEQMPELARRDWIAGAILWCYQDYKSRRNLPGGREEGYVEHGLVDENRQRKPSYYVWKQLNAPAALQARWDGAAAGQPSSFTVTLKPNRIEDLPSYPLHDYRLSWEICDQSGKLLTSGERALVDLSGVQTVSGKIDSADLKVLKLHVILLRPDGTIAAEISLDRGLGATAGESSQQKQQRGRRHAKFLSGTVVRQGSYWNSVTEDACEYGYLMPFSCSLP